MWYLILTVAGFIGGAVGMFLFVRNNPKYINIEGIAKDKLAELKTKLDKIL